MIMDLLFYRLNPIRYVYDVLEWAVIKAWEVYAFVFCFSWWHPDWAITKAIKTALVWWVNLPFSLPVTFSFLAIKAGADPAAMPFVSPEVAQFMVKLVNG